MRICEEKIMFEIAYQNGINMLCFALIIFSVLVFTIIKNKKISRIITNKFILIVTILILIEIITILVSVIICPLYKGCSCQLENNISKNYKDDRVIIVGDSRMSLIDDYYNDYDIPSNYKFIAKSGAKIDWFVNGAIPSLESELDKNADKYRYHVVVNMGVNDLSHIDNVEKKALEYFSYYKSLALKYPSAKFYLLSVNPINKRIMRYRWSFMDINNSDIDKFNDILFKNSKDIYPALLYYCDSNDNIDFKTYDGLHYKHDTSQMIIDYIKNKCVKV